MSTSWEQKKEKQNMEVVKLVIQVRDQTQLNCFKVKLLSWFCQLASYNTYDPTPKNPFFFGIHFSSHINSSF